MKREPKKKQSLARFVQKTRERLTVYFPVDDVVRGTLVMMVLMEKWAYRDSTEKLEIWAEKENQVRNTRLTDYEWSVIKTPSYNSPRLVLGRTGAGKKKISNPDDIFLATKEQNNKRTPPLL